MSRRLTDSEKKKFIQDALKGSQASVGNRYPALMNIFDRISQFNDLATVAELIPVANSWIAGPAVSSAISKLSFVGIVLFPLQQVINLINANEQGLRDYSFRATAYTITAWAFEKPIPMSSPRSMANLQVGAGHIKGGPSAYTKIWGETSAKVKASLEQKANQKNIKITDLKKLFRAIGGNQERDLCLQVLKEFEHKMGHTTIHIWRSKYSILYPD